MIRQLTAAVVFLASAALAQTKPHIDQVRGKPGGPPVQVIAILTSGQLVAVKLAGFVMSSDASGQLTISIDPAALGQASRVFNESPAPQPLNADAFSLAATPAAGTEEVYLNGIRQKPGFDYDLAGAVITFRKACVDSKQQAISCVGTSPTVVVSYSK